MTFKTTVLHKHPKHAARITQVDTPHGSFSTPMFMPVGTRAFVNYMTSPDLIDAGAQIILGGNTYHMLCAPGMDVIETCGGMHAMMNWQGPMLTDSGGFQVFSLSKNSKICTINEKGARFKHPKTGQVITLNAKTSIEAQKIIGADIIMAFDQCTSEDASKDEVKKALKRTDRWLLESVEHHLKSPRSAYGHNQALFGIIQGASFRDLREQSAEFVINTPVDGVAIGGEAIGFDMTKTQEIVQWLEPILPEDKIRYTMGVGMSPQDLIEVVRCGVDIFDCVAPTRNARHGALFCGKLVRQDDWLTFEPIEPRGRLLIKRGCYAKDTNPIMPDCECYTCTHHNRAYLHHLFKHHSVAYIHLASIHNTHVMLKTCHMMQEIIKNPKA